MSLDEIRTSLKDSNIEEVSNHLINYFINNNRAVHKLLINNIFPDPFNEYYKKKEVMNLLAQAHKKIKDNDSICLQVSDFHKAIEIVRLIGEYNNQITKNLTEILYVKLPYEYQLQLLTNYIQFIHFRSLFVGSENINNNGVNEYNYETVQNQLSDSSEMLSLSDITESAIEYAEIILKYITANNQNKEREIRKYEPKSLDFLGILDEVGFYKVLYLAHLRKSLEDVWSNYKYLNWITKIELSEEKLIFVFEPSEPKLLLSNRIAVKRYIFEFINTCNIVKYKEQNALIASEHIKSKITNDISNFESIFLYTSETHKRGMGLDILMCRVAESKLIQLYYSKLDSLKFGKNKQISYENFKKCYLFLSYLGRIYHDFLTEKIKNGVFTYFEILVPPVPISFLVEKISEFTEISKTESRECLELFIFKREKEEKIDLFSQPFIRSGENILFTTSLLVQMQYQRIIELNAEIYKGTPKKMGTHYEENLTESLRMMSHIVTNPNPISFIASDGEQVQFDTVAQFDSYILLIETKRVKRPFNPKEIRQSRSQLDDAIKQLNRRKNIVEEDWEVFRGKCSLKLPEEFPGRDKIIKIACLNIFEFTGLIIEDCFVADVRTLRRFWHDPDIEVVEFEVGGEIQKKVVERIWTGVKPNIEDLKRFLSESFYTKTLFSSMSTNYREILNDDLPNIKSFEYVLVDNPYIKYAGMNN
ncbi:hypothetical protein [Paenibacillus whitsoniae]|uniref:NERD domain-containing protein n=1 Tax=Paenibacillus whitsoniae TaxID=2496558 RepID=A0A3S0BTV2_9BACL|nr:hypothetical protein [Paenibacillus whitsoniae]RTE08233.1 hypothetical protein EJQ19_18520 [Paenibacillus whitsoniae]